METLGRDPPRWQRLNQKSGRRRASCPAPTSGIHAVIRDDCALIDMASKKAAVPYPPPTEEAELEAAGDGPRMLSSIIGGSPPGGSFASSSLPKEPW
jgi:hypothetical protein